MKNIEMRFLGSGEVESVSKYQAKRLEAHGLAVRVRPKTEKTKPITRDHAVTKGG